MHSRHMKLKSFAGIAGFLALRAKERAWGPHLCSQTFPQPRAAEVKTPLPCSLKSVAGGTWMPVGEAVQSGCGADGDSEPRASSMTGRVGVRAAEGEA